MAAPAQARQKTALISGAGIAGPSLAYWLARSGWGVTLIEKTAQARSSGNPVDVRGEAASIAREMGLESRLAAADTGVDRAAFVDGRGRIRAVIRTRRMPGADGSHEVEIPRTELAAALLDSVRGRARIIVGDGIAALHQDRAGVDVEFENGAPARFDFVFGADGLHSAVRRIAFGPESEYAHPFGLFVGTIRTPVDIADPAQVLLYNEPNRLVAIHPAGGHPGAAFIFRHRGAHDYRDTEAGRRLVETAYAGAGWLAPGLLETWRTADDIYFDAVTRIELPRWTTGRIALLGDAASCLSLLGEGSSNAIVAGKTLADALATHGDDHAAAFAAYERMHRVRVRHYQRGATVAAHFLVPATRAGIAARNAAVAAAGAVRACGARRRAAHP